MTAMPCLYSFRRCPYAIRARMALMRSGVRVELREVKLSSMPQQLLQLSAKATVPVLRLPDGRVIDESLDIMRWALSQADPDDWLTIDADSEALIAQHDEAFKPLLDRYKYADRHPELSPGEHRANTDLFLRALETRLSAGQYLSGEQMRLTDVAIMPFIRQFAGVDSAWFEQADYAALRRWLNAMLESELFTSVMGKQAFWKPQQAAVYL